MTRRLAESSVSKFAGLFSAFFSPAVVGFYHIAYRTGNLPVRYLGSSFQKVYYQKGAEQYRTGQSLRQSMHKGTLALGLIGILPFGTLFFFGEPMFSFVFGDPWETAGTYVEILAPGLFLVIMNKPAWVIHSVLKKVKARLIYTIIYTVTRILAIVIGFYWFASPETCLTLYSATLVIFNIYFIAQAFYFAVRADKLNPRTEIEI